MSGIEDYIPQNACPMHLDMRLLLFYDCYVVPLYRIHSHNRSTDNHLIITSCCAVLVSCVMPWWLLKSDHMWMIFHNASCFWFFSSLFLIILKGFEQILASLRLKSPFKAEQRWIKQSMYEYSLSCKEYPANLRDFSIHDDF